MSETEREKSAFAEWLARQHLRFDSRLTQAVYLPTGAPAHEVRLLEVNTGLLPAPGEPVVAVETTPALTDLPFAVWVADVTPEEWEQIKADPNRLPAGWRLEENRVFRRAG